ncbi:KH type-2 domain-containing protein [Citrus sinensis]|uniref:KH type-2 domain-containing protein n=1 Tax=Citrus sinensis TaxID=2711 RepID=A0ACB8P4S6_CITSI|nr:KH type-2 domain-containing protein [Citrus sinensis]
MATQISKKRKLNEVLTRELNENSVELYAEKVNNRGLCAIAQAEACYGVLRFIMESGAKGCEVIVSGKLRAQRAKSMKFKDGYMISSGYPVKEYIDSAVRHVLIRQGVIGIKVKIMLAWDAKGKQGPVTPLPDLVTIHTPKEEENVPPIMPTSLELPIA